MVEEGARGEPEAAHKVLLPAQLTEVDEGDKDDGDAQQQGHEVVRKVDALHENLHDGEH